MRRVCLDDDLLQRFQVMFRPEAGAGGAHVHGGPSQDVMIPPGPEQDLKRAGMARFSSLDGNGLGQVHARLTGLDPCNKLIEIDRLGEKCRSQLFNHAPLIVADITGNERLVLVRQFAAMCGLSTKHVKAIHLRHPEIRNDDVRAGRGPGTVRLIAVDNTGNRFPERQHFVPAQFEKELEHIQNDRLVIEDDGSPFSHDMPPSQPHLVSLQ